MRVIDVFQINGIGRAVTLDGPAQVGAILRSEDGQKAWIVRRAERHPTGIPTLTGVVILDRCPGTESDLEIGDEVFP